MSSVALKRLGPTYKALSDDIYVFCRAMGFTPNAHQTKLFNAVMRATYNCGPKSIAVKSGQGTGKTAGTCLVAGWRLLRNIDAMTVLTAPTARQCREIWLAEFRRLLKNADPFLQQIFDVTGTKIKVAGSMDWGVKTVTATDSEGSQGFHEKNMDIIIEEASGVDRTIVEQFKGTKSNPNALMIMIGNPNTRDCAFFDCFNSLKDSWKCLTFNAEDTPASEYFDPIRNKEIADEFGKNSDVYRVRVLGEFPHADPNCVISTEEVETCFDKSRFLASILAIQKGRSVPARQFGLDFARFGGDESVGYRRAGYAIVDSAFFSHEEPSKAIEWAFESQKVADWKDEDCVFVADAGGMGQGAMHRFYDANKRVFEFHNNGVANDPQKFGNRITEAWFGLRDRIRDPETPPYFAQDKMLLRQLTNRQYYLNKKGQIVLESKDEYMKRGHESPDRADSLVMAYYDDAHTSTRIASKEGTQGRNGKWTARNAARR